MIIRCKSCVAAFAVDDEKVADKKFAFTCPKCGIENIIDNRRAERTVEFNEPVSDDLFDEVPEKAASAPKKTSVSMPEDDIFAEEPAAKTVADEFDSFEEELPVEKPVPAAKKGINLELEKAPEPSEDFLMDELDIEIGDDAEKKGSEMPEPDFSEIELESELAGIDSNRGNKPAAHSSDRDKKITEQDEIDAMFAASSGKRGAAGDGDVTVDLDNLDIDFEEKPPVKAVKAEPLEDFGGGEDIFFEEEAVAGKPGAAKPEEDLTALEIDTLDLLEEPEPVAAKKAAAPPSEEDITIDIDSLDIDLEETEEAPVKGGAGKKASAADEVLFDFEVPEEEPAATAKKASSGDESIFDLEIPEAVPAKTVAAKKVKPEDEDLFDLEIPEAVPAETVTAKKPAVKEEPLFDFDITEDEAEKIPPEGKGEELIFDEDEIVLDLDAEVAGTPSGKTVPAAKKSVEPDEDITLDIDSLDIDIEEPVHASIKNLPEKKIAASPADESITLDVDSLDIDIEEPAFDSELSKGELPEEDIEIDLDSLDFDTEETKPAAAAKSSKVREIMKEQADEGEEEDIKLNLDELDIDIDEITEKDMDFVKKGKTGPGRKAILEEAPEDEDESITIDLDTLDIEVAENAPAIESEISEEDEKLTLEDAGITFDELTTSEKEEMHLDLADEEDIKLTLDEVDPDMMLEEIGETAPPDERLIVDTMDEFPEISLDELDEKQAAPARKDYRRIVPESDLDLDIYEEGAVVKPRAQAKRIGGGGVYNARGTTAFTVDFSLKYSRIGAILRLLQIYAISLIPHFVVLYVYTALSGILGFINQIVILSTGRCVEDFAQIAENTLRYYLYIETCLTGIVEDRPEFSGRERLDHQMQLNLTYPLKYSKLLAALRLSVLGIFLVTLPHLIMLWFVTLFVPFIYLAGIIWVIISGRWPNPLFMVLTMYFRYMARISAFMIGLTDQYPPFRFE